MLWVAQVAVEALPRMQVYNQNLTIRRLCIVIYSYNKSQQHALFLKSIVLLVKYTYNLSYRFYLCLNSFFQITLLIQNSEIRHWLNTNSCYVKRYGWLWPSTTVYIQIPVFWDVTLCHGASSCRQKYRSFATRVSQLKIWHFWVIGIERNVCRCTFNRYSVITQFLQNSPLESSCVIVALIENYSTSKPLRASPEKSQILSRDTVVANEWYVPTHYI